MAKGNQPLQNEVKSPAPVMTSTAGMSDTANVTVTTVTSAPPVPPETPPAPPAPPKVKKKTSFRVQRDEGSLVQVTVIGDGDPKLLAEFNLNGRNAPLGYVIDEEELAIVRFRVGSGVLAIDAHIDGKWITALEHDMSGDTRVLTITRDDIGV